MEFWLFFLTLLAEALLILTVLDFDTKLPSALVHLFKKLNNDLTQFSNSLFDTTKRNLSGTNSEHSSKNNSRLTTQTERTMIDNNNESNQETKPAQAMDKPIQASLGSKAKLRCFPSAPASKGYSCPIHKGSVLGCATFFKHEGYEFKLLCHGELFFRRKGLDAFRSGPSVPKEPGSLFIVKLDDTGSNIVTFFFEPSSRTLGEVNGHAEFLPVQTYVASSQEAHGLAYTPGQGCVFDWVYGTRSSTQYLWDYNRRYDVGWMHSSADTEELFAPNDELLDEACPLLVNSQNPLWHSLQGLDLVDHLPSPDSPVDIRIGFAHIESNTTNTQSTGHTQAPSSSALPALPVLLEPAHSTGVSTSTATSPPSKSVLRRTCTICNRVLRRPSALTIHMNAHYGVKPFQCNSCDYSSTNITNLQRHQHTKHSGTSSGEK